MILVELHLDEHHLDLSRRAVVVGILNRTRDSFYDRGRFFALDDLLRQADHLVTDGADVLEVGARAAGVGVDQVSPQQEVELVVETLDALHGRFDRPLGVDTSRADAAKAGFEAGAILGNDMSGFRDPGYLPAAAAAGAAVVATHIRRPPGVPDPEPRFEDVVREVSNELCAVAAKARAPGCPGSGS